MKKLHAVAGAALALASGFSFAGEPLSMKVGGADITMYGTIDNYVSYMKSSSGTSFTSLQEGAFLRSRLGFKGSKAFDNGLTAKFTLETGIKSLSGELAQDGRLFDRQAWFGLAGNWGEVRVGRQNTAVFVPVALYQDYTYRSLGSLANSFSFPARLDDDISYISPRINGLRAEVHYSFSDDDGSAATSGGAATEANKNVGIKQLALDYENGPFRVGFAGLTADTPSNFANQRDVYFYNFYANYDYGQGKIYLAHTESNNRSAGGPNFPLFPLGGQNDVATRLKDYSITSISADYKVTKDIRAGATYGTISDQDGNDEADGYSIGAYWQALENTTIYAIFEGIQNEPGGSYNFAGSAPLRKRLAGADVVGQDLTALNVGFLFKF